VIVNDNLDKCKRELRAILQAERLKRSRRIGLAAIVQDMLEEL